MRAGWVLLVACSNLSTSNFWRVVDALVADRLFSLWQPRAPNLLGPIRLYITKGSEMKKVLGAGSRIRRWRKSKKPEMKSFHLAKLIKISQGSLSDIENGKSLPSAATIVGFIENTDINVRWMLTGTKGNIDEGETGEVKKEPSFKINLSEGEEILVGRND